MISESGVFYQNLRALGLNYWLPRKPPSDVLCEANSGALLHSDAPVFCAHCLVLLKQPPSLLNATQKKIFEGMLKVLALEPRNIGIAWLSQDALQAEQILHTAHPSAIFNSVFKWAPYSLLFMGRAFEAWQQLLQNPSTAATTSAPVCCQIITLTEDPLALEQQPANKKIAYQRLLDLKAILHNADAYQT